jgi:Ca-activated chloride channel family protein
MSSVVGHVLAACICWVALDRPWTPRLIVREEIDPRVRGGATEDMILDVILPEECAVMPVVTPPPQRIRATPAAPPKEEANPPAAGPPTVAGGQRPVPDQATPASVASTGATTGSGLGPATTFFQVPAQGRSVVYVVDHSSSMGTNGRMELARRELLASLERLPESSSFQVIAYNRAVSPLRLDGGGRLVSATTEHKRIAVQLLLALAPEGATDHLPALKQALALQPDVIYFLTDADDLRPEQVRALTQLNRGRTSIHTIEMNTSNARRADMPLHILARENRGVYRAVGVN